MDEDRASDEASIGDTPPIKAVKTSHAIVDTLQTIGPATVTEIASNVDMSKGGAYKHLKTLKQDGFVVQENMQYRLSFRFLDIGGQLRDNHTGAGMIKTKMQELADVTGETSIYSVLENDRTTVLFRETGDHEVSLRARIGDRRYPHVTSAGKCILAQRSQEAVEAIFDGGPLPQVTANTITDMDTFTEELAEIRDRGYAYNLGELAEGHVAVAAPFMPDGQLLGACSVTGPSHRLGGEPVDEDIKSMLLSFVKELEHYITRSLDL